jgi:hypothetical protein
LWLSNSTCSYICVYINAVAKSVMLCLKHDFYKTIFKIKHKLYIVSGSATPQGKNQGAQLHLIKNVTLTKIPKFSIIYCHTSLQVYEWSGASVPDRQTGEGIGSLWRVSFALFLQITRANCATFSSFLAELITRKRHMDYGGKAADYKPQPVVTSRCQ